MNSAQTDRHIIWSDMSLDPDDWRDGYKEFLEINGLDDNPNDENELYKWMVETNEDYLSDERTNLNIQLSQPIIIIGDIGRWNGKNGSVTRSPPFTDFIFQNKEQQKSKRGDENGYKDNDC